MYLILTILLLVTQVYNWTTTGDRNKNINFDIDSTPLQIRTDSAVGSGDVLWVRFIQPNTVDVGPGITVFFEDPPLYTIGWCVSRQQFTMPVSNKQNERVWTFSKENNKLKLLCDGEQIFDFNYADSTEQYCKTFWDLDFAYIKFQSSNTAKDTASDAYRQYGPSVCKAGQYWSGSECKTCEENTFSGNGASACTKCPTDTTSPAGSTSVNDCKKVCKAGQYLSGSDCKTCEKNTFSGKGASACTKCPADTTSPAGSKSTDDCKKGEEDCAKTFTCSGAVTISVSAALAAAAFFAIILI